jgi:two-component system cell cycle response regulator
VAILNGPAAAARVVAERMCTTVAAAPVATGRGALQVTVSVGLTTVARSDVLATGLLARADAALDQARRSGRNRVVAAN